MKRIPALLLALLLCLSLGACAKEEVPPASIPDGVTLPVMNVGALTGPTGIGLMHMMDLDKDVSHYSFALAGTADILTPKLLQGELDMAAIPANLAAILNQRSEGEIQVMAINTLGVLYVVETGEATVTSLSDLAGKTIYATGKGSTPEYTLRYLLKENGLDPDTDVDIQFKSEPSEVVALLAQGGGIAMLPQPYVTAAQAQVEGLTMVLDLTEQWNALGTDSSLITGVMVVRKSFAAENPEAVAQFMSDYQASVAFAQENVAETAQLCEAFDLMKAAVAETAIPYCNITFLSGDDMKQALSGYLEVLYGQDPAAVGGNLPADDFYYIP